MKTLNKIFRSNKGATAVEYAIIAALVAAVAVAGFTTLGTNINGKAVKIAGDVGA